MGRPRKATMPSRKQGAALSVDQVLAGRLRQARVARDWTQEGFSGELRKIGIIMDRTTLAKIEKAQRKVRVDELLAMAACLDCSPLFLLAPGQLEAEVQLTPRRRIESFALLQWARGEGPLATRNRSTYFFMAPGTWVTWKPGALDTIEHGSGLSDEDAGDLVSEFEQRDRKKGGSDA